MSLKLRLQGIVKSDFFFLVSKFEYRYRTEPNNLIKNMATCSSKNRNFIRHLATPRKSENDKKDYRVIQLNNKLTALLISDLNVDMLSEVENSESEEGDLTTEDECENESTASGSASDEFDNEEGRMLLHNKEEKLAALALCVGVGSFSDPWNIQGMAHFLEHMVFMGSEKYPKENDFDAFIKKKGGSSNAETDCETTTFYFECQDRHLKQAIDKFSQFFIAPLMLKEAMTREREAIDSEFQMGVTSDENRKQQLLCSLAQSGNPVQKFTWGNLKTLRDFIKDDQLYEEVHKFRERHYSAHRMTLAIQAQLPFETLEPWIREYFSAVPNNDLRADDFKQHIGLTFDTAEFRKMYFVKSVKDICEVELTWALPPTQHMYYSKPLYYIDELLGHEGQGSLLSYLRKQVWALGISAGSSEDGISTNSMHSLFVITIILTDDGFLHLREVLNAVFSYIKMLQEVGPVERFFQELQTIQETKFRFAEEVTAVENVETLATNMQYYPPEDYITGSELFFEYNPEAIKNFLHALRPEDVNIMVSCKKHAQQFDKIEPWFGTAYCANDIPNDWVDLWVKSSPGSSFKIPEPNIFLTDDFSLLPFFEQDEEASKLFPIKVHGSKLLEVWYHRDVKFRLPQAFFYVHLISPLPLATAQNAAMMDLYIEILKQMLVEELYPAQVADLSCAITPSEKGITLKFKGYNQKLHLMLEAVIHCMAEFDSKITPRLFEALKEIQTRYYYNTFLKPEKLSKDLRLSLLLHTYWNAVDKHGAISKVTLTMLREFSHDFMKHMYVQGLFQGNLTQENAVETSCKVVELLKCGHICNIFPKIHVLQMPLGEYCCRVKSFNRDDTNSVVTNYYQSGLFDIKNYCILELIMMLMEEPVFDSLRTKEQLGYHVYSSLRYTFGVMGFSVTVNFQAVKHSAEHVDSCIEAFIEKFSKTLKKTKEKDLAEVRTSLIKLKNLSDVHLKEEVNRNWQEIVSQEYMFDRLKREVTCLEGITIQDLRRWFQCHVKCGNRKNFHKLSLQVVSTPETSKPEQRNSHSQISEYAGKSRDNKHELQSGSQSSGNPDIIPSVGFPLQFLFTSGEKKKSKSQFIYSIEDFKSNLSIYPLKN